MSVSTVIDGDCICSMLADNPLTLHWTTGDMFSYVVSYASLVDSLV